MENQSHEPANGEPHFPRVNLKLNFSAFFAVSRVGERPGFLNGFG